MIQLFSELNQSVGSKHDNLGLTALKVMLSL